MKQQFNFILIFKSSYFVPRKFQTAFPACPELRKMIDYLMLQSELDIAADPLFVPSCFLFQ